MLADYLERPSNNIPAAEVCRGVARHCDALHRAEWPFLRGTFVADCPRDQHGSAGRPDFLRGFGRTHYPKLAAKSVAADILDRSYPPYLPGADCRYRFHGFCRGRLVNAADVPVSSSPRHASLPLVDGHWICGNRTAARCVCQQPIWPSRSYRGASVEAPALRLKTQFLRVTDKQTAKSSG